MPTPKLHPTAEQNRLVNELIESYGIEPGDISFFPGDPKPFLSYEATCAVANQLMDLQDIDIQPVESKAADSLWLKCTLTSPDGRTRSAVGVANTSEEIDGKAMSSQQLYATASARAIRNALRAAGADLIKMHEQRKAGGGELEFRPQRGTRDALLAQAHILAREAGLIRTFTDGVTDKTAWVAFLQKRYLVNSSKFLQEADLADLVAVLRTIAREPVRKAA